AERVKVVVEAQAMYPHRLVECSLAGVAEGRMADVVYQRERFGEIAVQPERGGDGPRKLRHFNGVSEAAPVVIRVAMGKDLRLPGEASKGPRMNDAGAVALEGRAVRMRRLAVCAGGKRVGRIAADRTHRGERNKAGCCVWLVHARAGRSTKPGDLSQCFASVAGADSRAS